MDFNPECSFKTKVKTVLQFCRETRRPKVSFAVLSLCQFVLGAVIFALGVTAFSFSKSYRVGSFWAGPVLLVASVYGHVLLVIRMLYDEHRTLRRYKRKMALVRAGLQFLAVVVSLVSTVLDMMAAYLIQQTDFSRCAYTLTSLTANCESDVCSHLRLPPRTCYCCYLYGYRDGGGCEIPLFLGKQTYFTSVSSCDDMPSQLQPLLYTLGVLGLLGILLGVALFFNTSPIHYPYSEDEEDSDNGFNKRKNKDLSGIVVKTQLLMNKAVKMLSLKDRKGSMQSDGELN